MYDESLVEPYHVHDIQVERSPMIQSNPPHKSTTIMLYCEKFIQSITANSCVS